MNSVLNRRILVVDDNPAIHDDFRKVLMGSKVRNRALESAEAVLFDAEPARNEEVTFLVDFASQGKEALEKVTRAVQRHQPFALAFVDVRMPPGWDGVETIEQLWKADPSLQVVICTAYSDYSWEKMSARLGVNDNLVILKKPFDNIEVLQLSHALTTKWNASQQADLRMETLDKMVAERTRDLMRMNDEMRRSEERFAMAFHGSPVPLAIQSLNDDRFVDINEAFVQMSGFSRAETVGKTPLDLRMCLDFPGRVVEQIRKGHSVRNAEAQISTKSGDLRDSLVSLEPITLGGEPHVILLVQDISERLRLEEQLRHSQKMEAVGQLAAGIAHDFNNLLTIIEGHASLQLDVPQNDDVTESFRQIEQAAERAAKLTRQLLAFSRRQIMRPRALDPCDLIHGVTGMLRRFIGERVDLRCVVPESLPYVWADHNSVEQVLINLTVNARDAMPKGGVVTIHAEVVEVETSQIANNPEAQPGRYVCISVSDTGVGMDEATKARIFEPFFTTKALHQGTGMGLATVYGIARQHDGWIDVETAPGRGSKFNVYFPVTEKTPEPPVPTIAPRRSMGRRHTILIVEDDEAVRGLVKEILLLHEYRVLEAPDADGAMEIWNKSRNDIHLLLTDMVMPGSANGLELAQKLLADKPELKVIYTSGYSTELFASDVKLEEGRNYLPKPYLSSALAAILRNALESPEEAATVR